MAVGAQIDRKIVYVQCEVGAVIEIETAQEVLVGLASARMLGGDEPGGCLEQFARAQQRANFDIGARHAALAGGDGLTDPPFAAPVDIDHRAVRIHMRGDGMARQVVVGTPGSALVRDRRFGLIPESHRSAILTICRRGHRERCCAGKER